MNKEELLLEQWKIASELHRHEDNLTWNRFNYFVILNGILLSIFSAISSGAAGNHIDIKRVSILLSVVGVLTSLIWFLMQVRGKLYHRYRNEQAKDTERQLLINGERVLTLYEVGLDKQQLFRIHPLARRLMFLSTHNVVLLLSLVAFALWLFFLIYFLFLQ